MPRGEAADHRTVREVVGGSQEGPWKTEKNIDAFLRQATILEGVAESTAERGSFITRQVKRGLRLKGQ